MTRRRRHLALQWLVAAGLAIVCFSPSAWPTEVPAQALPHYQLLVAARDHYATLAARTDLPPIPALPAKSLREGDVWTGTPALRAWLAAWGDLPASTPIPAATDVLDAALIGGVRHFQERHGLTADGVLGRATWRALTTPLQVRIGQIDRTLARWRALPPNPYRRALFINIPRFRLYAMPSMSSHERDMLQIDVVVGQAIRNLRTPTFSADLTHLIFRPYWDVPRSIARNELLPAARRDAQYFARNHYELVDRAGAVVPYTAQRLDELAAGSLRVRQQPGPGNALGAVKFVMPNSHDVYLHDTPARALFARERRAYSHGCIRVADPLALARFLLQDDPAWNDDGIRAAMQRAQPLRVDLAEPVKVYIVYGTAIAREDGSVLFLDDLYGLDAA